MITQYNRYNTQFFSDYSEIDGDLCTRCMQSICNSESWIHIYFPSFRFNQVNNQLVIELGNYRNITLDTLMSIDMKYILLLLALILVGCEGKTQTTEITSRYSLPEQMKQLGCTVYFIESQNSENLYAVVCNGATTINQFTQQYDNITETVETKHDVFITVNGTKYVKVDSKAGQ